MVDTLDKNSLMFADNHVDLLFEIEKQAEMFAEIAWFEEQVQKR